MMTDPVADMLTRIRNAVRIERPAVDIPATKLKARVAQVLKDEGFILDYQVGEVVPEESGAKTFTAKEGATGPQAVLISVSARLLSMVLEIVPGLFFFSRGTRNQTDSTEGNGSKS